MWKVVYKKSVQKDLRAISPEFRYLIRRTIEDKLMVDPIRFGVPLRRNLKGLLKLRVGDYRVIFSVERETVTVHVIKVGHRRDVYD